MSNPDNAAAQVPEENSEAPAPTFDQQVNDIASKMVQGEDGNWNLPDDINASEEVKYAAKLEKRRRDTESALGKTRQELKVEKVTRQELEQLVAAKVSINLTPEESDELENLKVEDPDAWRVKMNELEQKATTEVRDELSSISSKASQQTELERRAQVLEEFNTTHSDNPITDESLVNDIPPRIVKKLETGSITYEEFLQEAYDYIVTPKKVVNKKLDAQPNLGSAGGSSQPSNNDKALQNKDDYSKTTF